MTYEAQADAIADGAGIPRSLFRALIQRESGWNPYARGKAGEIGLTQLMPGTAQDLHVDAWDPIANMKGGAAYLSQQFKKFGDWATALAAYNAGPGNVKAGKEYATDVLSLQKEIQNENPSLDQATPAAPTEQDWYHGSVLEQIVNWVTGSGETPIGKSPPPGKADQYGLPMPTKEQSEQFGEAASTVGKYAVGGLFVIIAIGVGVYVMATRGGEAATTVVKNQVA